MIKRMIKVLIVAILIPFSVLEFTYYSIRWIITAKEFSLPMYVKSWDWF